MSGSSFSVEIPKAGTKKGKGKGGSASVTSYIGIAGMGESDTQNDVETQIPVTGKLSNLHVNLQNALAAGDSITLTLCLRPSQSGACAESSLTCTINAGTSSCSDVDSTHVESAMSGDWSSLIVSAGGTHPMTTGLNWSATLTN